MIVNVSRKVIYQKTKSLDTSGVILHDYSYSTSGFSSINISSSKNDYVISDLFTAAHLKKVLMGEESVKKAFEAINQYYFNKTGKQIDAKQLVFDHPALEVFFLLGGDDTDLSDRKIEFIKPELVDDQLLKPADINRFIGTFCSLFIARKYGMSSFFEELELQCEDSDGFNRLNFAQEAAIKELVELVLKSEKKQDSDGFYDENTTISTVAVYNAAFNGCPRVLQYFLKEYSNYDVSFQTKRLGFSILMASVEGGNIECVKMILVEWAQNKKDIDEPRDKGGYTPFLLACYYAKYDILKLLYAQGAAIDLCTKFDKDWLELAFDSGNRDFIAKLFRCVGTPDILKNKTFVKAGGLLECALEQKVYDILEKNLPLEKLNISQIIYNTHYLGHVLNVTSGAFAMTMRSSINRFLSIYGVKTKDPIATELFKLANTSDWVDFTHTKKGETLKAKIDYCDEDGHTKAYVFLNQFLLDCNGGGDSVSLKDKQNSNGYGWHTENKDLIGKKLPGINIFKIEQSVDDNEKLNFKEKIELAKKKSPYLEKNLRLIFEGLLHPEEQITGNCTYFNPKLALQLLWAIKALEQKEVYWENTIEYRKKIKEEVDAPQNYSAFETWMAKELFITSMLAFGKVDLDILKTEYWEIYARLLDALAPSLEKLFKQIDDTQEIAKLIELIPEELLFTLLITDYERNEEDRCILLHLAHDDKPLFVKLLNAFSDETFNEVLQLEIDLDEPLIDEICNDGDLKNYVLDNLSEEKRIIFNKLLIEEFVVRDFSDEEDDTQIENDFDINLFKGDGFLFREPTFLDLLGEPTVLDFGSNSLKRKDRENPKVPDNQKKLKKE
ncbi:MAG: hypothetical protein CO175_04925 [Verrucomicrobia bacterium CG_4_9_14_3_um_filter_43_20]|nr:MAG: hypothetical protein CO175_04925 [Verrucomicrobia bacterium CG_4_9_14_3_um_filter_43_20]